MTQADVANAPVRLGDLFRIKHGFAFKGEFFSDEVGDIVLTPGNFQDRGGLKFRAEKDRSYTGTYPAEYRLLADDLLVVMTDLTQEARILGAPAFVPPGVCCLHNQRLGKIVDMDMDRLDRRFLYYLLNDYNYREYLRATATGSTVKHTSPGRIGDFQLFLPHLQTQRRIASILSAYDDLIEVNRRRVAILEEMARRLFEEWFVHLRFPGHEAVPVHDTPDGPLPEGWAYQQLHELARVNDRALRPATAPTNIHYVDIASVSSGRVDRVDPVNFADAPGRARRKVQDSSIIWSTVRPNRRAFAIIFDPEPNLIVSTGFAVIDASGVPASYLYAWTTSGPFVTYLVNNATGAAYPAVTGATFERAQVLVPPVAIVDSFGKVTDRLLRLADKLNGANARLAAARDLLLPRLVSGELSVAEAPEPERLLEAAD